MERWNPLQRIGTFCNKCRNIVCTCLDNQKILDEVKYKLKRHPLTCDRKAEECEVNKTPRDYSKDGALIPIDGGWTCPCGKYKQMYGAQKTKEVLDEVKKDKIIGKFFFVDETKNDIIVVTLSDKDGNFGHSIKNGKWVGNDSEMVECTDLEVREFIKKWC